ATVEMVKQGRATPRAPLRTAEFEQFVAAPPEAPGELPPFGSLFFVRRHVPETPLPSFLRAVVLAHKLREVRAQVGFTRIEPISANLQGELDLAVKVQSLGLTTDWLPATEILGEGVFLQLDEEAVRAWEDRPAVLERAEELADGY